MNQSEKVSTNPTKALTNQQSKQPEKHLQDKYLPDCKTRIKIPTSGPLAIPMTNDYLFRALLQKNNHVLKGLVCSLLHLSPEEVRSVTITNPIVLGDAIDEKTFILDIRALLNDSTILNLEMQVINEHNWADRSLSYLCRDLDQLKHGDDYSQIQPVIQISFLNFTLFPDHPEFFATYKLLNVKNHTLYSDKLQLSVVDLTKIQLATSEDKEYHIDYWATLFKCNTWEELTMLAENNEYLKEATETVYEISQEEQIRMQCEAREDYNRRMLGIGRLLAKQTRELKEQAAIIAEKDSALMEKDSALAEQTAVLAEKDSALAEKDAIIAALQAQLMTKTV